MGLLANIFSSLLNTNFYKKLNVDNKSSYVFYRIVDFTTESETYALQCVNTKAVFHSKIEQIVCDTDILYNLHPLQACFVGIEFAKFLRKNENKLDNIGFKKNKANFPKSRYGSFDIRFLDRKGNIAFIDKKTNQEFLMNPKDISLSEELIQEFDAAQSYFIGLQAGIKIINPVNSKLISTNKTPHLYLVK